MTIEEIRQGIRNCTKCPLHLTREKAVPGVGSINAEVAFLGEAPGRQEDQQGLPFVGDTGQVLNELMSSIGLERAQVYLFNVLACKPPRNRDPRFSELDACRSWLDDQIALLPKLRIIVALGRYASLALCPGEKPADLRGSARLVDGKIHLFMLHPAATLHNPQMKPELENSFQMLKTLL